MTVVKPIACKSSPAAQLLGKAQIPWCLGESGRPNSGLAGCLQKRQLSNGQPRRMVRSLAYGGLQQLKSRLLPPPCPRQQLVREKQRKGVRKGTSHKVVAGRRHCGLHLDCPQSRAPLPGLSLCKRTSQGNCPDGWVRMRERHTPLIGLSLTTDH